jgi:RNA polymerase-binding transcription factor DksA
MSSTRELLEAEWRQHVSTVVRLSIDICDVQAVDSPGTSGSAAGLSPEDALRVTTRMIAAERFILREIEAALVRLEQGTYGRCEQCGSAVAAERLEILPYTRYCARCQPRATRKPDRAADGAFTQRMTHSDGDRVGAH